MPLDARASNAVIDTLLRGQAWSIPSTWWVALVTTMGATNALAGVEVHGGSYARVPVSSALTSWTDTQGDNTASISIGSTGLAQNALTIQFANPTANWGLIVGYELWDNQFSGHRWIYDTLPVPMMVSADDPPLKFPPGALQVSFS